MLIMAADYHSSFRQIAFVDTEIGECRERKFTHTWKQAIALSEGMRPKRGLWSKAGLAPTESAGACSLG